MLTRRAETSGTFIDWAMKSLASSSWSGESSSKVACSSMSGTIERVRAKALRSCSGKYLQLAREWVEYGRPAVLHRMQEGVVLRRGVKDEELAPRRGLKLPMRIVRVSSIERSSSRRQFRACEISGFREATDW